MADQNSFNIPWAGLAVVAALVSGSLLAPRAFDQLRLPEKERAQPPPGVELEVDARLWEDPFFALRRFQAERDERCSKPAAKALDGAWLLAECRPERPQNRDPATFLRQMKDKNLDDKVDENLVILALVPGNPFVGAEESRRRTRYALLAGLQSQDYVPEEAERIGLLQFEFVPDPQIAQTPPAQAQAQAQAGSAAAGDATAAVPVGAGASTACNAVERSLMVPYEMLSQRPLLRGDSLRKGARYAQIALLWVDEAALPAPRFDTVARIVYTLFQNENGTPPRLVVIGPSSSDALRIALSDLSRTSKVALSAAAASAAQSGAGASAAVGRSATCRPSGSLHDHVRQGYAYLSKAEFLNAAATASDSQLSELDGQRLQNFLNARFAAIIDAKQPLDVEYRRMLATDSTVLRSLVKELLLRMPDRSRHRIVLVAERDSLYAQGLVSELRYRIRREVPDLSFDVTYYFRGLDGVTTRDSVPKSGEPRGQAVDASTRAAQAIEWPETRDQLDYLRRMAVAIKQSEALGGQGPISAIGILGSDVHDKLLVLQALHETFADKVFFTTDMDARYLHPRTLGFTRNLIVASSLPLKIARGTAAGPAASGGAPTERSDAPGLQTGTPPLRDMYQTAAYLAARRAACRDAACRNDEDEAAQSILDAPSVYEIGRNRAVPVAGYAFENRFAGSAVPRALLAAVGFSLVAALLLVWPSTPALLRVRGALLEPAQAAGEALDLPSALMAALHIGLLAFALGSVIELIEPGHVGFIHILLLTALAGFGAILGLYPQVHRAARSPAAGGVASARRRRVINGVLICLLAAALAWMAWRAALPAPCSDCEPVEWLEGVSAWPSHLLHLLALFAIACALDYSWSKTSDALGADALWLTRGDALHPITVKLGLCVPWRHMSLAGWRRLPRSHVDFRSLWWQYAVRGQNGPRIIRVLFWVAVALVLAALLFWIFNEGQLPAVPARSADHRALFGWTLAICVMLLTALIVAIADATMLACRFIWYLNRARTSYPTDVVSSFALSLGPEHADLWTERLEADPAQRLSTRHGTSPLRHTLLDDWIDVQVVARRTRLIAPLVIGPFIVVALLVVARSRLFDNWSLTLPIAAAAAAYLLWLIVLAVLLKTSAEQTRRRALERMDADLRWLRGSPRYAVLAEPFQGLVASVQSNSTGAFAGFFEQPLFRALLVPLGGAGGAQLFDHFLLAR